MDFNEIEKEIFDDWEEEFFFDDELDCEEEYEMLNYYKNKDVEKLEKKLMSIPDSYNSLTYVHLLALYNFLTKKENVKETLIGVMKLFDDDRLECSFKGIIYVADALKSFYKDKKNLEKLNTFILRSAYHIVREIEENVEGIEDIVLEAGEWLLSNLELSEKQKKIIKFIVFEVLDEADLKEKRLFNEYVKLLWELRDSLDLRKVLGPLFKGIGWTYANIKSQDREDIINYLINNGIEKSVANELYEFYANASEIDDNALNDEEIPF